MTGLAAVNTNFRETSLIRDTQRRRLEFARARAAIRQGAAAITPKEMSLLVGEAEGSGLSENVYGRWEKGQRKPDRHWLEAIASVAGVEAAWLDMWPHAPVPEDYGDWLAMAEKRDAGEKLKRPGLPMKDERDDAEPLRGGRKRKGGDGA